MALTPMTPVQQRVIDDLVARGRLGPVPADLSKAKMFIRQAQDVIDDLPNLTRAQNRYNLWLTTPVTTWARPSSLLTATAP